MYAHLASVSRALPTLQIARGRGLGISGTPLRAAPQKCNQRSHARAATAMAKVIDSHLHVWASAEESEAFPYFPGQEPTFAGDTAALIKTMDECGVDGALIIQPINHKFDHSYVAAAMEAHPSRLAGALLADPTPSGGGVKELERLAGEGFCAVRFNPYLWPEGSRMDDEVGKAMFKRAGELGLPVGFMCFKGLTLHIEDIEALCEAYPDTKVIMDHFGFCKGTGGEDWKRLLGLARFPQVHVKASAFFRVSSGGYPYDDIAPMVGELVAAFGASRLLWGSDFPFITQEEGGYKGAREVAGALPLSNADRESLLGGTVCSLLPGAWKD